MLSALWVLFAILGGIAPNAVSFAGSSTVVWIRGLGQVWALATLGMAMLLMVLAAIERQYQPGRRAFLHAARTAVIGAPALITGYGVLSERKAFHVKEVDIRIPGLHKDLQGLRIVQLSDIHLSPYLSEEELAWVVDMANETRAHIGVVTGDFITGRYDPLEACFRQLARLRCDAGVLACNGNHEIFSRTEERTQVLGARQGMRVLRRQAEVLRFGNARLNIAGVDYQHFRAPYLVGAERLLEPGMTNVLLSHNPDVFPVAAKQGYDLTLAGHTHGGQVTVEILHQWANVARIFTPYVYGRYEQDGKSIYVTRGIGTVGIPARVGAPPEVSLVRLCAS